MPATLPRPRPPTAPAAPAKKPLRSRHEAFCQHFVLGGNATYAAMKAGYTRKWASNQGYRLMRQEAIRVRIAEIRSTLARAYCLDADVLLGKLEAIYQSAHENNHFHAAARAVEIQARIARQSRPAPNASSKMTINDEFSRPGADGFHANSMAYGPGPEQK